ncbi:MAG TPA: hypothetical protein PLC05_02190 [bacterium]|mgnify:FL=1|nr:hypothetical protein [bacterium]HOR57261.1 hypothetical protein [bacterium]HPL56292.1 hypothetical protein [bacterium]
MRALLLKITAYFMLLFGIALGLVSLLGAVALFVTNPEANTVKVVSVAMFLVVFAVIAGLVAFSFFGLFMDNAKKLTTKQKNSSHEWQRAQNGAKSNASNSS